MASCLGAAPPKTGKSVVRGRVVAADTGPIHLACAIGTAVVGIYGPTDPARNGPYGAPERAGNRDQSKLASWFWPAASATSAR